jgi:hypothetical protein
VYDQDDGTVDVGTGPNMQRLGWTRWVFLTILVLYAAMPLRASAAAEVFQFEGSYYYYNGLSGTNNNSYCLYATPPAGSSQWPVMNPESIPGAFEWNVCGGGYPPATDFTYNGAYYSYSGGASNTYCLYITTPSDAGRIPVINPQSIPGAAEQAVCGGGLPPATGFGFTFDGNYYYYADKGGNNAYCLYATLPSGAAQFPVMDPQSIPGATEEYICGGGAWAAQPFTFAGKYYFYYSDNTYCQYATAPTDGVDFPVVNPAFIPGAQSAGICGPATVGTYSGGTGGTPAAAVALNRGAINFQFAGAPAFGHGFAAQCPGNVLPEYAHLLGGSVGFQLARISFPLADVYQICSSLGAVGSWNGNDPTSASSYDFSYLDNLLATAVSGSSGTKIILQVALDGSLAWVYAHPDCSATPVPLPNPVPAALPNPVPAGFACLGPAEQARRMLQGIPDYLSPQWVAASTQVLNTLVAHIQASQWGANVVGYELMNGVSLDNNYPISYSSPTARKRFQSFLGQVYSSAGALASAWQQQGVTFATAQPTIALQGPNSPNECPTIPTSDAGQALRSQLAPLFVPAAFQAYADSRQFAVLSNQQVAFNFADAIKSATHGQVVVGMRSGEFPPQATWCNEASNLLQSRTIDYFTYPSIDFYEVWEHYDSARYFGTYGGSGEPLMPVQGLAALNKLYVVQNDFAVPPPDSSQPPEGWNTNPVDGYASTFPASVQKLRRVFVNSLVNGMSEYLWQLSVVYDQPQLDPEWAQEQQIASVAMQADRSRVSDLVYVMDTGTGKYLADAYTAGYTGSPTPNTNGNAFLDQPGQQLYLTQFPEQSWARAGVPFDSIFLDQIATAKPYKVYVFFNTIGLSTAQIQTIQSVLQVNKAVGIFVYADGMVDSTGNAPLTALGTNISTLTNMPVVGTTQQWAAEISAAAGYLNAGGIVGDPGRWSLQPAAGTGLSVGTGLVWPGSTTPLAPWLFPSFTINWAADPAVTVLATYTTCGGNIFSPPPNACTTWPAGSAAIAEKALPGGGDIIYSATPYLPPGLIRYALRKAGAYQYSNTEDDLYLDRSFVGIHTMDGSQRDGSIISNPLTTPITTPQVNALPTPVPSWNIALNFPSATALYDVFNHVQYPANVTQTIPVSADQTYLFYRGTQAAWQALGGQ